jgi:hypothetical protein
VLPHSLAVSGFLSVLVAGLFSIGVYPGPLFKIADNVTRLLFAYRLVPRATSSSRK